MTRRGAPRLGVICDLSEEGWPSMDLFGELLLAELLEAWPDRLAAGRVRPRLRPRAGRVGALARDPRWRMVDRLLGRYWDYPHHLRAVRGRFDLFHVVDHSYAHLVHQLPAARTGVVCHDLDAFAALLAPDRAPRPLWLRALARRTLRGLRRAALVFCVSAATRSELERHGLVAPDRLVYAPPGVAPEFVPDGPPPLEPSPYVLHVGSCIPRKRIDVLLDVFAVVRARRPSLRLVQAGGTFTDEQTRRIQELRLGASVVQRRGLTRADLARLYRGAAAVLLPSEGEGFGLPLLEALACAAPAVASDIPALREVGGEAACFAPVGEVAAWVVAVERQLTATPGSGRQARLERAARFTWEDHARAVADAYLRLAEQDRRGRAP